MTGSWDYGKDRRGHRRPADRNRTSRGQAARLVPERPAAARRPGRLDFSDLDLPECLLVKPIRLWLHGVENWALVARQYEAHFGPHLSMVALTALRDVIDIINAGGRRTMTFHKAWCRQATGDERALVALLAACQARDHDRARAMALRLVSGPWQEPLVEKMADLGAAFAARGHRLVNLRARPAPPREAAAPPAAHPRPVPASRP